MLFAFVVGGLGFELCVFVAGWRHALRSEWPFIIIIIIIIWAGIVDGAKLFKPFHNNNNKRPLTPKSMPPAGAEHAKFKT